ncbi:hypothetical protein IGI04_010930 [Brassica rapa subsp. trilocularis]|uniref:Uncharacterized protein n=1 Tax=Brassica rapa subsp. trilocularis TaxID=1813537 RepID=A0ABQ7N3R9_BRACM|nr:hypothetical protein IGI04_010930 [Brassica rapa subsp. trilocularis]
MDARDFFVVKSETSNSEEGNWSIFALEDLTWHVTVALKKFVYAIIEEIFTTMNIKNSSAICQVRDQSKKVIEKEYLA